MAKKSSIAQEKIQDILAEHRAGASIADLTAKYGVSASTIYNWKSRAEGDAGAKTPARRGRGRKAAPRTIAPSATETTKPARGASGLAAENAQLKVMLVDLMLERDALRARLSRR